MANYDLLYTGAQVASKLAAVDGKADKVSSPTDGDFAALDSNGNLTDSGHKHSDYQTALSTQTAYTSKGTATKVPQITTNSLGQVTAITEVTITQPDITGKADKVSSATNGNFAGLDSNGNLTDSGKKASDFATSSSVTTIEGKIPTQASSSNQLADKEFVNSSISTATATFKGTYNLVSDLSLTTSATTSAIAAALATAVSGEDNNDYAFVLIPTADATPTEISHIDRYKFNGTSWGYEFSLNNSSFTAAQWAAINSGITSTIVSSIGGKYEKPSSGIPKTDLDSSVQTSLGKADSALQSQTKANWNETNTSSDAYIQNKPTIPTVNDSTVTIQANGATVDTFTTNASSAKTINLGNYLTSTTAGLKIEVVSALPASPDSNTIYIVQ